MAGQTAATWEKEYNTIRAGFGSPATVSLNPINEKKNRYKNIVAYDHSRVLVKPLPVCAVTGERESGRRALQLGARGGVLPFSSVADAYPGGRGRQENGYSDYINANWIPGPEGDKSFIATQGPVPDAYFSFWQMVWETNSNVIVMLTNEIEGGKLKCHRYAPLLACFPRVGWLG